MSMSVGDSGTSKRKSAGKPLSSFPEDDRSPELIALDDMSLRENYKASEKLFEVRSGEKSDFYLSTTFSPRQRDFALHRLSYVLPSHSLLLEALIHAF